MAAPTKSDRFPGPKRSTRTPGRAAVRRGGFPVRRRAVAVDGEGPVLGAVDGELEAHVVRGHLDARHVDDGQAVVPVGAEAVVDVGNKYRHGRVAVGHRVRVPRGKIRHGLRGDLRRDVEAEPLPGPRREPRAGRDDDGPGAEDAAVPRRHGGAAVRRRDARDGRPGRRAHAQRRRVAPGALHRGAREEHAEIGLKKRERGAVRGPELREPALQVVRAERLVRQALLGVERREGLAAAVAVVVRAGVAAVEAHAARLREHAAGEAVERAPIHQAHIHHVHVELLLVGEAVDAAVAVAAAVVVAGVVLLQQADRFAVALRGDGAPDAHDAAADDDDVVFLRSVAELRSFPLPGNAGDGCDGGAEAQDGRDHRRELPELPQRFLKF